MKEKIIFLNLIFSFFIMSHSIAQCNIYELSLTEKVNNATNIFEGKVTSKTCFWNASHTLIFTSNIIDIYKVFKGDTAASQVEIITEGGTVGDEMHRVAPCLNLSVGDVGIFTAMASAVYNPQSAITKTSVFQCYGSLQGFFKYDLVDQSATTPFKKYTNIQNDLYTAIENAIGKMYKVIRSFDANQSTSTSKALGSINSFSPTTITAGTNSVLTIDGSGFGASQGSSVVQFKNADDGGASYIPIPFASQYISWSDTEIKVIVPSQAGTGTIRVVAASTLTSSATLTISYAELNATYQSNPYQTDHVNRNSAGGLTWQMYTGIDSNVPAKESFIRAMNTWRCTTHINWIIGATTSVNTIAGDGTNVIRFDIGSELSAGVLGQCSSYWAGCGNPATVWYVKELDMAIDDGTNWQFGPAAPTGSQYDLESVMLHELGHGHQLTHVINNADVMNYAIANATSKRILNSDDKAAGNDLMSRSVVANSCGPGPMTALTGQCAIGAPSAGFSATPVSGCAPLSVTFSDTSTNSPTTWAWDVNNDGTTDYTTKSPTHVYNTTGNYSVKLKVTNANGVDSITKTNYITVTPLPVAGFSNTINSGTVNFTNSSSNATSYSWDFGDTNNSTGTNASHTYTNAGTYTVTLTATNSCGHNSFSQTITIGVNGAINKPVANFSGTPVSGCTALSVTFTDLSTNTPTSWFWDIDNNGTIDYTTKNPTHVYNTAGNYSVKLKVVNGMGADSIIKTNYITVNPLPVAGFSNTINSGTVTFTNSSGNATSYSWDFGDTNNSTGTNASHTYTNAGTYTVTLTATNSCGHNSFSQTITTSVNGAVNKPVANFSGTPVSGCTPLSVTFTDLSTNNPTSWAWDINNDGTVDYTTKNPTHVYTIAGNYSVKLKAGNANGNDSITKTNYITINPLPVAGFSNTINSGTVSFTNSSSNATSYSWDFGDANNSAGTNPSHTYTGAGTYTVTLTATNSCGHNSFSQTITINITGTINKPTPNFSATPVSGCTPLSVTFTDLSTNNPTSWAWDINNDGTVDYTTQNPTHVYTIAGNYSVKLKAGNASGNDSITKTNYIAVNSLPVAGYSNTINSNTVTFTNSSTNAISYSWDFGDLNSSTSTNISHTYMGAKTYTVILTATNSCGSKDSSKNVTIAGMGTGISESVNSDAFLIYPNPSAGIINIEFSVEMKVGSVTIFNYLGENAAFVCQNNGPKKLIVDLSNVPNGVYCIVCNVNGNVISKNIVLVK